ncbi:MAG TPA: DUF4344 domain-containing metallopeptidase [archaeon]|nr:DUF4344 domain-containing metallopeptidase [archaeon]
MDKRILVAVVAALAVIAVYLAAGNHTVTGNAVSSFTNTGSKSPIGQFELSYSKPTDEALQGIYNAMKQNDFFGGMLIDLNKQISLPVDILVNFTQCGSAEAFYDPQVKTVNICYEFIENMANFYAAAHIAGNANMAAINNAEFVMYHEIGHSLIDALNLPITGREEDAADQFAVLSVLSKGRGFDAPAAVTAVALGIQGENQDPGNLNFWDEHSLNSQRFYNILCWLYGDNPEKYQSAVDSLLPQERSQRCGGEFARMSNSWTRLLQPYFIT